MTRLILISMTLISLFIMVTSKESPKGKRRLLKVISVIAENTSKSKLTNKSFYVSIKE